MQNFQILCNQHNYIETKLLLIGNKQVYLCYCHYHCSLDFRLMRTWGRLRPSPSTLAIPQLLRPPLPSPNLCQLGADLSPSTFVACHCLPISCCHCVHPHPPQPFILVELVGGIGSIDGSHGMIKQSGASTTAVKRTATSAPAAQPPHLVAVVLVGVSHLGLVNHPPYYLRLEPSF